MLPESVLFGKKCAYYSIRILTIRIINLLESV